MIMKQVIIDGKEMYVPINKEEAKEEVKKGAKLIFTDEDEKDDFYEEIEDEQEDDDDDESENFNKRYIHISQDAQKMAQDISNNVTTIVNNALSSASNAVKGHTKYHSRNHNNGDKAKLSKLLSVIPFMDDDDIHELLQKILKGDESLKDIEIEALLPFLSEEDCDALFLKALEDGNSNYHPGSVAPFVSEKCLSILVDKYIAGEITLDNIDSLYPFMSSKDVKRVFKHIISQK